jgi:hypothetical protein
MSLELQLDKSHNADELHAIYNRIWGFGVRAYDNVGNYFALFYLKENNYKPIYSCLPVTILNMENKCHDLAKAQLYLPENTIFKDIYGDFDGGSQAITQAQTNHMDFLQKIKSYQYYLEIDEHTAGKIVFDSITEKRLGVISYRLAKDLPNFYTPQSQEEQEKFLLTIINI